MQTLPPNPVTLPQLALPGTFLKETKWQVVLLFGILLLFEAILWGTGSKTQNPYSAQYTSFYSYLRNFLLGLVLPELCSIYVLSLLIRTHAKVLNYHSISLSKMSILRYQLSFIPLFLVAFFLFFPITIHVRFLLRELPHYTDVRYLYYLSNSISWETYFLYLPFVFVFGYMVVNVSLIRDFLEVPSLESLQNKVKVKAVSTQKPKQLLEISKPANWLALEGHNNQGAAILKVEEAFFFETAEDKYFVNHPNGRYQIGECLNALEENLNPYLFFRVNRKTIINLHYLKTYTYWESGKYKVTIGTPQEITFMMTKARYQELKEALHKHIVGDHHLN